MDFVAKLHQEIIYVQVCYLLSDQKVIDREFGNLLGINDNYRKVVVTMDPISSKNTYQGVEQWSVADFCRSLTL